MATGRTYPRWVYWSALGFSGFGLLGVGYKLATSNATAWDAVPGVISQAEVSERRGTRSGSTVPLYSLAVQYQYTYDGAQFSGSRISTLPLAESQSEGPAAAMIEEHGWIAGQTTTVYVDPREPANAVLLADAPADSRTQAWVVVAVLLLVAGGAIVGLREGP